MVVVQITGRCASNIGVYPASLHPMHVGPNPSSRIQASDTMESDDEIYLTCLQSFQKNYASLASETALL